MIPSEKMKCLIISLEWKSSAWLFIQTKIFFVIKNYEAFHFFQKKKWGALFVIVEITLAWLYLLFIQKNEALDFFIIESMLEGLLR